MIAEPVFVDTNVLVYVSRRAVPEHVVAREAVDRLQDEGHPLWISPQVLREYVATVTRPQASAPAMPMQDAVADARRFAALFNVAEERPAILERLLHLLIVHRGAGKQVHDTNLVATMLDHGIQRLLTFNAADFRRFSAVIAWEPGAAP